MSKTLIITVGPPGSGKSYLFKDEGKNVKVVSRDKIRFSILDQFNETNYFKYEKDVYNTFIAEIYSGLINPIYDTVIADATHINQKSRDKLFYSLNKLVDLGKYEIIFLCFNTSYEVCCSRNALRQGREKVPEDAMLIMYNSTRFPSIEELAKWKGNKVIRR